MTIAEKFFESHQSVSRVSRKRSRKNNRVRQPEPRSDRLRTSCPDDNLVQQTDDGRYELAGRWPLFALSALTWLLSQPLFEPFSWWPFGFIVFVPWLLAVCAARNTRWVYLVSFLLGAAFFLAHLHWLYTTTPEGYVAASVLLLGLGFPLAVWPVRHLCRRRGLSVAMVFPVVWVAVELLRSRGPLAFPWFLLGHSQIRILSMIQIADVAGVFGVSFVLAMVNGWLVDLMLRLIPIWRGHGRPLGRFCWQWGVVSTVFVLATFFYGRYRLASQTLVDGPRLSVVQGDFLLEAVRGANGISDEKKMLLYLREMTKSSGDSPDMIVLPETPWGMVLNKEARAADPDWEPINDLFVRRAKQYGAYVTVGGMSEDPQPAGTYPAAHRYNSAFVYAPGEDEPARYNKIHLVPFGEYVPFRYTKGLFWLYRFLNDGPFNPWGRGGNEYSLTSGRDFTTFEMRARSMDQQVFKFGITICYEDVIPQVFRKFVTDGHGRKQVDFMLNISNDGWFGRGAQQPQHLVNCAFRAVENRVAVARAANTGVSGFIRPDGSWYDLMSDPGRRPRAGGLGHRTARIQMDRRVSFYSCYGDLFAGFCALLALAGLIDAIVCSRKMKAKKVTR